MADDTGALSLGVLLFRGFLCVSLAFEAGMWYNQGEENKLGFIGLFCLCPFLSLSRERDLKSATKGLAPSGHPFGLYGPV